MPCGWAPTSSATPTKPTATPSKRTPVTRTSRKATKAITALKIGTDAWMIDASPESIRVSPHESSQNGIAVLMSATTTSQAAFARSWRSVSRAPDDEGDEQPERHRREAEPADDQRRRGKLAHGDLDEEERRAPERGEPEQHG